MELMPRHLYTLPLYVLPFLFIRYVLLWFLFEPDYWTLRRVPGPFWARFTKLRHFFKTWDGYAEADNITLHRKYADKSKGEFYAPIVRLAPNMYSIASPDKAVYGIHSKMPKSSWYEGWKHPDPDRWTLFPDRDIKRHGETRRKFQAMYSMSSLVSYEGYVDECAEIFQKRLEEMSRDGKTVNMGHWLQCYAFDVIGDITYSKRFGFLDDGLDRDGLLVALDGVMEYSTLIGIYAGLHPWVYGPVEKLFPKSGAAGRSYLMKFVGDAVKKRRAERQKQGLDLNNEKPTSHEAPVDDDDAGTDDDREDVEAKPEDFLDKLLNAQRDGKKGVNDYHIYIMGLSNIIAGSDTTAVSLSSILYNLIKYPNTMAKLREEIRAATEEGHCDEERVGFKDSQNMRYLQACIKEGLRLHAATGLPLWRVVPEGGATICGQYFPAGVEVGINTWVAHYDEDIWGKDAGEFRPERWIEAEDKGGEKLKTMESYYMPFGLGSRTCLGRHISHLEISKLIPQMVRRFDFELEHPDRHWKTKNHWFVKPQDFMVTVKLRA